jgi:hypothetical protein
MSSGEYVKSKSRWFTKSQLERQELEIKKELEKRWNTRI